MRCQAWRRATPGDRPPPLRGARAAGRWALGTDLAKSTLTHHFWVLRESGVIAQTREGTTKLTSLRRDDLDARFPGLPDAVLASQAVAA